MLAQTSAPSVTDSGALHFLPGIFALLVLAAGWYYLFYSPAAHRLEGIEENQCNRLRVRLRRVNGVAMMLLAVAFYAACYTVTQPAPALMISLAIMGLLVIVIVLAWADVRLTARLRRERQQHAAAAAKVDDQDQSKT